VETVDVIASFVQNHNYLGYGVLFFGMIIEGELWLMMFGLFANLEIFSFGTVFLVAYLGVLVNDILFYQTGAFLRNRYKEYKLVKKAKEKVHKFFPDLQKEPGKAIFISKFIAGINHPTLILLGFVGVDFRYFMKLQVIASFLWTLVFLCIGFLFGDVAIGLGLKIRHAVPIIVALIFAYFVLEKVIKYIYNLSETKKTL
jgi:membrane protein DedA with SNARE-associated domain